MLALYLNEVDACFVGVVWFDPIHRSSEKDQNLQRDRPIPISSEVITPRTATRIPLRSSRTSGALRGFEQLADEKLYSPPVIVILTFFCLLLEHGSNIQHDTSRGHGMKLKS